MSILEKELGEIGFSDKEARVYLAMLELGPSPVQKIAEKSKVVRATAYVMIDSLIERGLVSSVQKDKKRLFTAAPPEQIIKILEKEKNALEEKLMNFSNVIPSLRSLSSREGEGHPHVTVFEGESGIDQMREQILGHKEAGYLDQIIPLDLAYRFFPPHENDHRKKIRKDLPRRVLYTSQKGPILKEQEVGVERMFIGKDPEMFEVEILISADRVYILDYSEKMLGISIEHRRISQTLHRLFNLMWNNKKGNQN